MNFKNTNCKLLSIKSSKLSKAQAQTICKLKDQHWKFGIKAQISWYNKNIKKNDIHNLFFIKSKLIGYTSLRIRSCKSDKAKSFSKYLLFDTLIIDKKYRGRKLSNLLMNFNNSTIEQLGYPSFLICNKNLLGFYRKHKWIKLDKKNMSVVDYSFSTNGMIFNNKKLVKQKYFFFIKK